MLDEALKMWAKNIARLDHIAIKRECGVKPYGIEYRIMLEQGVAKLSGTPIAEQIISDIDLVVTRISRYHPRHMLAVREYYLRGSYRAVRLAVGCSQHMSVRLVREGENMIRGGLMMLS